MTKQEFIDGYCKRSNVTWDELCKTREAIPCDCGEDICGGWQMVPIDSHDKDEKQRLIKTHRGRRVETSKPTR